MAKHKGRSHRNDRDAASNHKPESMMTADGGDDRNVRPPTASEPARSTTAQTDTDHSLEQQFAKMKEEADKRLQEAQENASREAERQESIKRAEAEVSEMYGRPDPVNVNDNDRYLASKYQEQRERELQRAEESHKVTVEEAIAAYGDYVSEDSKIPNTDTSYQAGSVETSIPTPEAQTTGYSASDLTQKPIPEMPSMESLHMPRTEVNYAQEKYDEMMHRPVGDTPQGSVDVPYTQIQGGSGPLPQMETPPSGGSTADHGFDHAGYERTVQYDHGPSTFGTPDSSYDIPQGAVFHDYAGGQNVNVSTGYTEQKVNYQSEPHYGHSGLGAAQMEYDQQMQARPGAVDSGKSPETVPFASDTGNRTEGSYGSHDSSGQYTASYTERPKEASYESADRVFRSEDMVFTDQGSKNQTQAYGQEGIPSPQEHTVNYETFPTGERHTDQPSYDRSGVGLAQQEYEHQMRERVGASEVQPQPSSFTETYGSRPEASAFQSHTEEIVTDGSGRYYNSQTREPVYKGSEGQFHSAEEAVALGVVSQAQVETDRRPSFDPSSAQPVYYETANTEAMKTTGPSIREDYSGTGLAQKEFEQQMHMHPGESGMQGTKGTEFVSYHNEVPYAKLASEGISTDGNNHYFNRETKEPVYRTPEGTFHTAEEAVSIGLVSNEQVQADRQAAWRQQDAVPYSSQQVIRPEDVRSSSYKSDRSSVGLAQQEYDRQMHRNPGAQDFRNQETGNSFVKGTEFAFQNVPYSKTTLEGIVTDGKGSYFDTKTREPVYVSSSGSVHRADEAVALGFVTKEQVQADRQTGMNADLHTMPFATYDDMAGRASHSAATQMTPDRSGVGMAQQEYERGMHVKPGSPEAGNGFDLNPQAKGTEFFRNDAHYTKTFTDGILTDGRGRFINSETREPVYRSPEGKFHSADEAVTLGLISQEQVRVDRQEIRNLQQKVTYDPFESKGSGYQIPSDHSGIGMAQQEYERGMHVKPGSPEAGNGFDLNPQAKGTKFLRNDVHYTKTSTDGILTDGRGRFINSETREPVYRSAEGKFHSADEAVTLGLISQEQVRVDRQEIRNLQQKATFDPFEDRRTGYQNPDRSGIGAVQQDFEGQMHIRPDGGTVKVPDHITDNYSILMHPSSGKEIITDGKENYLDRQTREFLYRDKDGAFHNAQDAVSLGIVTKEKVEADRVDHMKMAQESEWLMSQGTSHVDDRSGLGAAQYEYNQKIHLKPNAPGADLAHAEMNAPGMHLERTTTDGILTDGKGRYFNSETRELLYKDKAGAFHNAKEALELGVVTKEQVEADRMNVLRFGNEESGIPVQGNGSDRSGFGMPGKESFAFQNADSGMSLVKTADPGILTDGKGCFYNSDTRELVYRGKDGGFYKADEAIALGIVTKDQVDADRLTGYAPVQTNDSRNPLGNAVRTDDRSGLSMAQQDHDMQMHARPNDPFRPDFAQGSRLQKTETEGVLTDGKGAFFDSERGIRLYRNEDGKFVSAKDAIALGIVTEEQAKRDLINDRISNAAFQNSASARGSRFITTDSVRDKAKFVDLRRELGFGANISGFIPDDTYNSMLKISQKEGQGFGATDTAFAQSRIFGLKIKEGLSPADAYRVSKDTVMQMLKEGHTAESIVATLNPNMKQSDIEFLKRNGGGSLKGKEAFAFGQLHGKKAIVGFSANPDAKKIAARILDKDGKLIRPRAAKGPGDAKDGIPFTGKDFPAGAVGKNVSADFDNEDGGIGVVRHNLYHPTGRTAAIARGAQSVMMGVGMMGLNIFYSGAGESASGLRKTQDYLDIAKLTVGMSIVNGAQRILNRPLALEMAGLLKNKGAASLDDYKKALNARFAKVGVKAFSTKLHGTALVLAAQKQMAAIKLEMARKGSTAALKEAYAVAKEFRRIGVLTTFAKTPKRMKLGRRSFRLGGITLRLLMSSTGEAFKGLDTVTRYTKNAMMGARGFLWVTRNGTKLGVYVTGGSINLTGKAATKVGGALVKAASKTNAAGAMKVGHALEKYGRGVKKVGTAKRRVGKKVSHIRNRAKDVLKDPFGIKRRTKAQIERLMIKAWGKLTARFAWLAKLGKGVAAISKVAAAISTVLSAISQILFFIFGIFILFIVILIILNLTIPLIVSLFNFGSYDETSQDIIVDQIKECYEEDIQKMIDIAGDYDQSTIDYDDTFRDIDKYNEMKSDADASSFIQSTNCAEIIAMTMVRFEYDIDIADDEGYSLALKREIKKYIKELYYGSHELHVDVTTSSYQVDTGRTDADGYPVYETRTKKTAALTYRTYYFEYMFDESMVTLGRSETPVIYTGDVAGGGGAVYGSVTSWDDMYVNMRQNGFTHEGACGMMANLAFETAGGQRDWTEADIRRYFINTTLISNDGYDSYGIVQWTGGRKTNLINWCLENGYDHTTIAGQLAFMYYEMSTSYTGTYNYLRTSGHSAHDCGRYVADHYEVCAEQYREGRAVLAETFASMYAPYKDDYSELVKAGDAIVQYAVQYVGRIHYTQGTGSYIGTRYLGPDLDQAVYKGGTPTIGTDCSGFVYSVFKHFGITTPTYTGAYTSAHQISLNDIQPGDILYRDGHVGIYIGNGQLVQSSSCYGGDHSGDLNQRAYNASSWTRAYRYWE